MKQQLGDNSAFLLVPKKNNEDLKRHIQSKMDILGKRTKNAIVGIVRKKIRDQEEEVDDEESDEDSEDVDASG